MELTLNFAIPHRSIVNKKEVKRVTVPGRDGALGIEKVADAIDAKWIGMFETNVLGLMRMTRALLPKLLAYLLEHTEAAAQPFYQDKRRKRVLRVADSPP